MKKIIITIAVLAFVPIATEASFVATNVPNKIEVGGKCSANVKIELAQKSDPTKIVYSAGSACKDGKFSFADDLAQWNLVEGDYIVMIDGEKKSDKVSLKKNGIDSEKKQIVPTAAPGSPDSKFLEALVGLQRSILDMQVWLAETNYPQGVKDSVDVALDGLQALAGKITEILWSTDNGKQIEAPIIDNNEIGAQIPVENLQISVAAQPAQTTENLDNSILASDGLSVSEDVATVP